jgi:hypothetical protein
MRRIAQVVGPPDVAHQGSGGSTATKASYRTDFCRRGIIPQGVKHANLVFFSEASADTRGIPAHQVLRCSPARVGGCLVRAPKKVALIQGGRRW